MEMTMAQMEAAIEAVLFTMGDSVETSKLALAIGQDTDTTRKIVRNLSDKYKSEDRGIKIIELEDSFQMCTKPECYRYCLAQQKSFCVLLDYLPLKTFLL